jgi:hypothetical protein
MSPQRRRSSRGPEWKPPRDRREVITAVVASLAVIIVTASLVWFLRPNRDSASTAVTTTVASATTTTPAGATPTTVAPTTTTR